MRGVTENTHFLQTTQEYVWYKKWPPCYKRKAEFIAKGPKPDEVFPLAAAAAVVSSGHSQCAGEGQLGGVTGRRGLDCQYECDLPLSAAGHTMLLIHVVIKAPRDKLKFFLYMQHFI